MDRLHRSALQRGQEDAPERIAQRHTETTLERLGNHRRLALGLVARGDLELVGSDQFLPVLLDCHVGTHRFDRRGSRARPPLRPVGMICGGFLGSPPDENIVCHTRRLLRGRQPLWGIGVTSRMEVMVNPADCSERSADSRPEPGPATSTSRVRMPCSWAFLDTSSAATCAAYGVEFRAPLKPIVPADDQAMVLPCASVMVMVVLLNDEFTWATPEAMFLRSRRRTRVASLA